MFLPACPPSCLSLGLSACQCISLPTSLSVCQFINLPTYLSVCQFISLPTNLSVCVLSCFCMLPFLPACLYAFLPASTWQKTSSCSNRLGSQVLLRQQSIFKNFFLLHWNNGKKRVLVLDKLCLYIIFKGKTWSLSSDIQAPTTLHFLHKLWMRPIG